MKSLKKNKQYWNCQIGPVNINELGFGADGPIRSAVENKFIEMFGKQADICSSGWGLTEEMKTRLDIISVLQVTDPDVLIEIDKILSKRKMK